MQQELAAQEEHVRELEEEIGRLRQMLDVTLDAEEEAAYRAGMHALGDGAQADEMDDEEAWPPEHDGTAHSPRKRPGGGKASTHLPLSRAPPPICGARRPRGRAAADAGHTRRS